MLEAVAKRPLWDIQPRSFMVLTRMCSSALDRENGTMPGRLYYGGWVPLAMMLGYDAPADGEPLSDTAKQAVKRAVRDLTRAGLIKPVPTPAGVDRRFGAYRITL